MGANKRATRLTPQLSIGECKKILRQNGFEISKDNIKLLCEQLYQLADITIACFLAAKKNGSLSDLLLDDKEEKKEEKRMS